MSKTIIAVADSVFPSLDPAKEALKDLDPDLRMADGHRNHHLGCGGQ